MDAYFFDDAAELEIQGAEVLNLLTIERDHIDYEVIGFDKPKVFIRDFREGGKRAIETVVTTGSVEGFADSFNFPSQVSIYSLPKEDAIMIELKETSVFDPEFLLWMAVGLENDIPFYDYVFSPLIRPYDRDQISILSVYKRPGFIPNKEMRLHSAFRSIFQ